MKNLEFDSVLTGGRYPKGFCLPDYLRENGKFSCEKTLKEIVREEYGEIDESGLKISVKDVTDEKFDGNFHAETFGKRLIRADGKNGQDLSRNAYEKIWRDK